VAALSLIIAVVATAPSMTFDPWQFNNATVCFAVESPFRISLSFIAGFRTVCARSQGYC
jgi:hypothetical protein